MTEEEGERKNPERDEFWRKVFRESGAHEMKYLGISRRREDECAGQISFDKKDAVSALTELTVSWEDGH